MANLWTYEQYFNTLNDGTINGQDSWTASGSPVPAVLTTAISYEGTKCLNYAFTGIGDQPQARRVLPVPIPSGTMYFSMRATDATKNKVLFLDGWTGPNTEITGIWIGSNGKWHYYNGAEDVDTGIAVNLNVWYRIGIAFECGNGGWEGLAKWKWKFTFNGGVNWTGPLSFMTGSDQVFSFYFVCDSSANGNNWYVDTIGPTYLTAPFSPFPSHYNT